MKDLNFYQMQKIQVEQLLRAASSDPILAPQLQNRLKRIEREIKAFQDDLYPPELPELPRAAFFLKGDGVQGSTGIRPSLAGNALIHYETMFTEQALHDEREFAKTQGRSRRKRGASIPHLFFTGTPRGSFGLEFVPQFEEDYNSLKIHAASLRNVAEAIYLIGKAKRLDAPLKVPPNVLYAMKKFMALLAENGALIRLAFSDSPALSLTADDVRAASDLLTNDVEQTLEDAIGKFQGLTFETGHFDLLTADKNIAGTIDDAISDDEMERINSLTHQQCVARLLKTTVHRLDGTKYSTFVLLGADPY